MRRVRLDDPSIEGATLARDLCSPGGDVLARAGLALTARSVRALREYGAGVCFIQDAASAGVEMRPIVETLGEDGGLLRALQDAASVVWKFVEAPSRQSTPRAVEQLKDLRIIATLDATGATDALRTAAAGFAERASKASGDSGFLTERQSHDDLFGHTMGVTALVARLGADIGFQAIDLHDAVMATLTHDIGMLMVPEEIRRTPVAQRTPAQQRRYQDHTRLGEAIMRPLDRRSPAVPIVALEHHEEQSGGGHPQGLTGGNRILRNTAAAGPPRISLISEVVAVADRYERLVSPAPGVPALPAAAARRILGAEAGPKLNAEVVGRFLDLLPQWPLGTEVVLHGGGHEGARAVVVELNPSQAERPVVRVFASPSGERITPVDLPLKNAPGVTLTIPGDAVAA
jgi:HD-GYP domain-containing protein (c-di-GMP phosphodiesterase class II)